MPNVRKELQKCKHPNSRKTISLTKKVKKSEKRDQHKLGHQIKQNVVGEKLLWFKEKLPDDDVLSKKQILELIQLYLSRYDDELEQIKLKNAVGQRKSRQHASREDVVRMCRAREAEEFATCGTELPDLADAQQVAALRRWDGELRYLQNFKLRRFARKHLQQ